MPKKMMRSMICAKKMQGVLPGGIRVGKNPANYSKIEINLTTSGMGILPDKLYVLEYNPSFFPSDVCGCGSGCGGTWEFLETIPGNGTDPRTQTIIRFKMCTLQCDTNYPYPCPGNKSICNLDIVYDFRPPGSSENYVYEQRIYEIGYWAEGEDIPCNFHDSWQYCRKPDELSTFCSPEAGSFTISSSKKRKKMMMK